MKREARKERWNGFVDSPKDYWQTVKVSICEGELSCRANRCYQNRGKSVASLVKEAYLQIDVELNDFDVDFYTGDFSKKHGHSFSANQYHENLIPDFNFDSWPEVGVQDYEETCKKILERSEDAPVSNRLFWAGNINTHPRRFEFACIAHQDNNIEFHNTGNWSIIPGQTMLKTGGGQFISLPDHCNYKYLIDIEGNGKAPTAHRQALVLSKKMLE